MLHSQNDITSKTSKTKAKFCTFYLPKKITKCGQNARVSVSSSAEDPTSYFWRGAAACAGRLNRIYQPVFNVRNIAMPNYQSRGEWPKSSLVTRYGNHCHFQVSDVT